MGTATVEDAIIYNLSTERRSRELRNDIEAAMSLPRAMLEATFTACAQNIRAVQTAMIQYSKMCDAFLQAAIPQALIMPPAWVEAISGKANLTQDMQVPGTRLIARYFSHEAEQPDGRRGPGWKMFSLEVTDDGRSVTFFHGDLKGRTGDLMQIALDGDGYYRLRRFSHLKNGMTSEVYPKSQELVEGFLLDMIPAINSQTRQSHYHEPLLQLVK